MTSVLDSGYVDNVMPPSILEEHPIRKPEGSRRGQKYTVADGKEIPNMGERNLQASSEDGSGLDMAYQVAEVTRPLTSISDTCDKGNLAIFGRAGGVVINMLENTAVPFQRVGKTFEMDLWVQKRPGQGFGRQEN